MPPRRKAKAVEDVEERPRFTHKQSRDVRPDLHQIPPQPKEPLRDDMILTHEEAAAHMRMTPMQVRRLVYNGYLPSSRVGKASVVFGVDVRELLESTYRGARRTPFKRTKR